MIYGGVNEDTFSRNEDTLYSGEPGPCGVPKIHEHVDRAFELVQAGKYAEAEKIVIENMLGRNHPTYTTLGSLRLRFDHEKRDRSNLSERPEGCFAQVAPVPWFASEILGGSVNVDSTVGRGTTVRFRAKLT